MPKKSTEAATPCHFTISEFSNHNSIRNVPKAKSFQNIPINALSNAKRYIETCHSISVPSKSSNTHSLSSSSAPRTHSRACFAVHRLHATANPTPIKSVGRFDNIYTHRETGRTCVHARQRRKNRVRSCAVITRRRKQTPFSQRRPRLPIR